METENVKCNINTFLHQLNIELADDNCIFDLTNVLTFKRFAKYVETQFSTTKLDYLDVMKEPAQWRSLYDKFLLDN